MNTPADRLRARLVYGLFYYGPLAAWLVLSLLLATSIGRYNNSMSAIYMVLAFLAPQNEAPDVNHMYGLTYVVRRSAYLLEYGILALLLARALQGGAPALRRVTLLGVAGIGLMFALLENGVRFFTPGRHGGWDDILLSLANIALFTGVTYLFFAAKSWERRRFGGETAQEGSAVQ